MTLGALLGLVAVAPGCTSKDKASEDSSGRPVTPPAPSADTMSAKTEPAKPLDAPVERVDGYQVIRAKTKAGDTAELNVKAPEGWAIVRAPDSPDPHAGKFTLAEATAGLPEEGKLAVMIKTSMGALYCDMHDDKAPNTVANFVGLARGKRKFWDRLKAEWTSRPYYDGTIFHRVVPGFMIQGGDHTGTGQAVIGYKIHDEAQPGAVHDRAGQLCMANNVPNMGDSQFFITEAPAPHLDGGFTVFGQCEPAALVQRISRVPQTGKPLNRPRTPVMIERVEVRRLAGGAKAWMPAGAKLPPVPGLPVPGRAVQVDEAGKPTH